MFLLDELTESTRNPLASKQRVEINKMESEDGFLYSRALLFTAIQGRNKKNRLIHVLLYQGITFFTVEKKFLPSYLGVEQKNTGCFLSL